MHFIEVEFLGLYFQFQAQMDGRASLTVFTRFLLEYPFSLSFEDLKENYSSLTLGLITYTKKATVPVHV